MSGIVWGSRIGPTLCRSLCGALLAIALTGAAAGQSLIPTDFFNAPVNTKAPAAISANSLAFDANTGIITAVGDVVVDFEGYQASGQRLVYNRKTQDVHFEGAVILRDPSNNTMATENLEITGGMKKAFISALTITGYDGSRITAESADYDKALRTLLINATYAPCGTCVDAKGRRIGWSVSAPRLTTNAEDGSVYIEQPRLELLGIPVAWLPFLWLPDTSAAALANVETPTFDSGDNIGYKLAVPFRAFASRNTDVVFTPTLLSRQGFLLGAEWVQRFDGFGTTRINASGIYQLDRSAFTGTVGDLDWRGAIQTSGEFRPVADWTTGWSYTVFTDAAYLTDYKLTVGKSTVNEVYVQNLNRDTFFDARVQQFNLLGNVTAAGQGVQGQNLPVVRFSNITRLAPGMGQVEFSGHLLGVHRDTDSTNTVNGVPYVFGHAGNKVHANFEAGWQNQWIGGGGFVATPYLGGRADVAYYDGTSALLPGATSLWSATPIAAMDVRFPMSANDGSTVHLVEPIGQLVYRGNDNTAVGVTNDNAQSFVFDDTNLFSYNRFSGSDRQETGLRANLGGRYQVNFEDGGYLELIAGQSFHLAGANAFAAADPAQTAAGAGLANTASYAVLGAYGALSSGFKGGGKLLVDTGSMTVARAGLGLTFSNEGYSAALDYHYIAANAAAGVLLDQQEIGGQVGVPVADYWTVTASTYWDLAANAWLQSSAGVQYDDGYLMASANATRTGPTNTSPDDTRFTASFKLKAPAGFNMGYTYQ